MISRIKAYLNRKGAALLEGFCASLIIISLAACAYLFLGVQKKNLKAGPLDYNGVVPVELGSFSGRALSQKIELGFKFRSAPVKDYQNVFQTSAYNSGIRMEISPKDQVAWLLIATGNRNGQNDFASFKLLDKLEPGRWYALDMAVSSKDVKVKIDGALKIDQHLPAAAWRADYLRVGTGYDDSRRFLGDIKDFKLVYSGIFLHESKVILLGILLAFWLYSLINGNFGKFLKQARAWAVKVSESASSEETADLKSDLLHLLSLAISISAFVIFCRYLWNERQILWAGLDPAKAGSSFTRACYLAGMIFLPGAAIVVRLGFDLFSRKQPGSFNFWGRPLSKTFFAAFGLILVFLAGYIVLNAPGEGYKPLDFFSRLDFGCLLFSFLALMFLFAAGKKADRAVSRWFFAAGIILVSAAALAQVISMNDVAGGNFISYHFSLIVGAVNQIIGGRTILVDQLSQYGSFYPYAAAVFPILFGRTLVVLSGFFVFLIGLSWLFVYFALGERMGKRSLWALISLAILAGMMHSTFESRLLMGDILPYYQYTPIRLIFPAFFSWFALVYLRRQGASNYVFGMLAAGFSVFWNLDTGLPLAAAWCLFLIYQDASRGSGFGKTAAMALKHLAATIGALAVWVALYSGFAYLRSGSFPHWGMFFEFQKIFYKRGVSSLPMYPLGPWNIVVFVYLAALSLSIWALIKGRAGEREKYYFFLAILGSLLFSYFQGRAHFLNLFAVSWPAGLLLVNWLYDLSQKDHFSSSVFGRARAGWEFKRNIVAAAAICAILSYGLTSFAASSGEIVAKSLKGLNKIRKNTQDLQFKGGTEFIAAEAGKEPVLILSFWGDYYHYFSRTYSPLLLSSLTEIVVPEQIDELGRFIGGRKTSTIFVDQYYLNDNIYKKISGPLTENYMLTRKSPHDIILMYQKKNKA